MGPLNKSNRSACSHIKNRIDEPQGVVGWYVTRPALGITAPRPTLRELAVLQSLGEHLNEQGGQQGLGQGLPPPPPPVLVVVHLGLQPREATQAWSYGVYYLGADAAAAAADGSVHACLWLVGKKGR